MKRKSRSVGARGLSGLSLAFLLVGLIPAAVRGKTYEETATVVLVEVPVQVLREGKPVRGLSAQQFEVFDRGKRQEIIGFNVVDLARLEPDADELSVPELPVSARRHFLLLFDLSFSEPSAVVRAQEAARRVVAEALHPADLAAVATYSAARGLHLELGFTSDRRQLAAAVETLGLVDPIERVVDPLGLTIADAEALAGVSGLGERGGGPSTISGLDTTAELVSAIRDLQPLASKAARDQRKNQILAFTGSLQQLGALLGSVQGRTHVVLLSEGFDSSVLLGTGGFTEEERRRLGELGDAAATGEYWRVDSEERFGSGAAQSGLEVMLEEFRRAGATIQAVDIGGLVAEHDSYAEGQEGLFIMANETGGELYRNYNDLGRAMGKMLERTSVTYVLAFQPKDLELDGSYHRLKVKLEDAPKGTRLVHRSGYYAPRPFSEQSPLERRLRTAGVILGGGRGGEISTSVLAAPFKLSAERSYVPVLLEIDGPSLLADREEQVLPAEIFAYALDREGSVRDFFAQALRLDLGKAEPILRQSGFKFWGHFELPPGDYLVRVLVRDARSGAAGVDEVALRVPDFEGAEAALLPPLFPEPPDKWLLGREEGAQKEGLPYPFMMRDRPFIPAARPELKARGEAPLCLVGYNLGEGALAVEAEVFAPDGASVAGGKLVVEEHLALPTQDQILATFRAGKLAPGAYRLAVTVTDEETGRTHSSSIPVVVTR